MKIVYFNTRVLVDQAIEQAEMRDRKICRIELCVAEWYEFISDVMKPYFYTPLNAKEAEEVTYRDTLIRKVKDV